MPWHGMGYIEVLPYSPEMRLAQSRQGIPPHSRIPRRVEDDRRTLNGASPPHRIRLLRPRSHLPGSRTFDIEPRSRKLSVGFLCDADIVKQANVAGDDGCGGRCPAVGIEIDGRC